MPPFSSRHFLVACLVAAFAAPAARAQTNFIWANTGSDWNVPASWTKLAVPTATDFRVTGRVQAGGRRRTGPRRRGKQRTMSHAHLVDAVRNRDQSAKSI